MSILRGVYYLPADDYSRVILHTIQSLDRSQTWQSSMFLHSCYNIVHAPIAAADLLLILHLYRNFAA